MARSRVRRTSPRLADNYTLTATPAGPAMIVTTTGGLVHTYTDRGALEAFLATVDPRRFPGLLEAWDAAEPAPVRNPTVATVEQALAMTVALQKGA